MDARDGEPQLIARAREVAPVCPRAVAAVRADAALKAHRTEAPTGHRYQAHAAAPARRDARGGRSRARRPRRMAATARCAHAAPPIPAGSSARTRGPTRAPARVARHCAIVARAAALGRRRDREPLASWSEPSDSMGAATRGAASPSARRAARARRATRRPGARDARAALPPVAAARVPSIGCQTHPHLAATMAQQRGWRITNTNAVRAAEQRLQVGRHQDVLRRLVDDRARGVDQSGHWAHRSSRRRWRRGRAEGAVSRLVREQRRKLPKLGVPNRVAVREDRLQQLALRPRRSRPPGKVRPLHPTAGVDIDELLKAPPSCASRYGRRR